MTDAPTPRETADHIGEANEKVAADHAELARLAEAATAGPWETYPEAFSPRSFVIPTHHASDDPAVGSVLSRQDAAFIAAANPATVLALLSEIAEYRDDVGKHIARASQAKRQRDELRKALELAAKRFETLRDLTDHVPHRIACSTWAEEARQANHGADQ